MFIKFIKQKPLSFIATVIVASLLLFQSYKIGSWRFNRSIIHDITSYYSYLPAAFIYNDFNFDYRYDLPQDEPIDHVWVNTRGDSVFQKMSIGLSYFYMPTFLAAHWYTVNHSEYNANGFSRPYQMALNINTLIFGLLGLVIAMLICIKLFSDLISSISLILLYAGTNLLYYISGAPGLSHPYSFFLIALIYLLTLYYFEQPKTMLLFIITMSIGIAILVRPTNAILCLFPVLYGLNFKHTLKAVFKQPTTYLILVIALLIPWVPQFLYWKFASGHFIFYSYDQEGFFFNNPHLIDGLFSYRKGWLVYTPLMLFALTGLFVSKTYSSLKRPLIIILPLFAFVVFSWWCWWYGGSLGSRVMIETYPLLLIGIGGFVKFTIQSKWLIRIPLSAALIFCIVLNLNQTWQYSLGMLHWDSMTKRAYWSIFMKNTPPNNFQDLIIAPDYKKALKEGE